MNTPKTTEFSAHLSWAAMRRYLQDQIPPTEAQRTERHLQHCPRCSSAMVDYIQSEEPERYKQYAKKLKGVLKSSQSVKRRWLSPVQVKAIRTGSAVVVLLIFAFFAVKTVINKHDTPPRLPSETLAVDKSNPKTTVLREKKTTKPVASPTDSSEEAEPREKVAEKMPVSTAPKKANARKEKKTDPVSVPVKPVSRATPKAKPVATSEAPATQPSVATSTPTTEEDQPVSTEEKTIVPEPTSPVEQVSPVPTVEKLSTQAASPLVAPSDARQTIPIPADSIQE